MTEKLLVVFIAVLLVILVAMFLMIPVWLLWNILMPDIFGLKEISVWQALGLLMLSGFLFRSLNSS